jgi:hypothetical protein
MPVFIESKYCVYSQVSIYIMQVCSKERFITRRKYRQFKEEAIIELNYHQTIKDTCKSVNLISVHRVHSKTRQFNLNTDSVFNELKHKYGFFKHIFCV